VVFGSATLVLLTAFRAAAEPVTLRFATVAPEGTGWAREFRAFARDVEIFSEGQVRLKWYFGGIAGGEVVVPERIKRGQIDGEAAAITCTSIAPSLRVMRVVGMFRRREETHAIIAHLRPKLDELLARADPLDGGSAADAAMDLEPRSGVDRRDEDARHPRRLAADRRCRTRLRRRTHRRAVGLSRRAALEALG
jgi:hypothetical protein